MLRISDFTKVDNKDCPCLSEMLDIGFISGNIGPNKRSVLVIHPHADMITNFYINLRREPNKRLIWNYYLIYDKIELLIGGSLIFNLPIDYVSLYYRVIKGVPFSNLTSNNDHLVIPVNINELLNIPMIPLFKMRCQEARLTMFPDHVNVLNHNLVRQVDRTNSSNNSILPKDVWRLIMEYLDDTSWDNLIRTCKYFYALTFSSHIEDRYKKHIPTMEDLELRDSNIEFMYHKIGDTAKERMK